MKRKTYHITHKEDHWQVKAEGNKHATRIFDTKQDAIPFGRYIASAQEKGQLIIHRKDGVIQTEYTYGVDPFPPRG